VREREREREREKERERERERESLEREREREREFVAIHGLSALQVMHSFTSTNRESSWPFTTRLADLSLSYH
jgi:hypothetical protein